MRTGICQLGLANKTLHNCLPSTQKLNEHSIESLALIRLLQLQALQFELEIASKQCLLVFIFVLPDDPQLVSCRELVEVNLAIITDPLQFYLLCLHLFQNILQHSISILEAPLFLYCHLVTH